MTGMDFAVAKCAFCLERHLIELDGIDTWFCECACGARGFTEDDAGLPDQARSRPGFTVKESSTPDGRGILMADPLVVFVDERALRWYVVWYLPIH
jgi:hypothetical protein